MKIYTYIFNSHSSNCTQSPWAGRMHPLVLVIGRILLRSFLLPILFLIPLSFSHFFFFLSVSIMIHSLCFDDFTESSALSADFQGGTCMINIRFHFD